MTGRALGRAYLRPTDTRLHVTGRARRHGMGRDLVKACLDTPGGRRRRLPARLAMADRAIRSKSGSVRVAVAPAATPRGIRRDRSPIIVTSKAGRVCVGRLQAIPRLLLVVEREVSPHETPALSDVADAAVARKRLVRRDRAPLPVSTVPRRTQAATENRQDAGRQEQHRNT